jgi:hypothetical protein
MNFMQLGLSAFFDFDETSDQRINDITRRMLSNSYRNQLWGQKEAIWIDCTNSWTLYTTIPELRIVINRRAEMMAGNRPVLRLNGELVESHWLLDMIKKPNPLQSWGDIIQSIGIQDGLYSNTFCYAPKRVANTRNLIYSLPANRLEITTTGKYLDQISVDGLIEKFTFQYDDGHRQTITPENMIYTVTPDGMNLINAHSRVQTLQKPLSNILAAYKKRNILLESLGSPGILSAKNHDMNGALPVTPEEKKQIRKDWHNTHDGDIIITETEMSWLPMSFPTRDLMLMEEIDADFNVIIDTYGLHLNVFSSKQGATYENIKESIKMVYSNTIKPETDKLYERMMTQLGLSDQGYTLEADFTHLPIMQKDQKSEAEAMSIRADAVNKIIASGVELTEDEKRALLKI